MLVWFSFSISPHLLHCMFFLLHPPVNAPEKLQVFLTGERYVLHYVRCMLLLFPCLRMFTKNLLCWFWSVCLFPYLYFQLRLYWCSASWSYLESLHSDVGFVLFLYLLSTLFPYLCIFLQRNFNTIALGWNVCFVLLLIYFLFFVSLLLRG